MKTPYAVTTHEDARRLLALPEADLFAQANALRESAFGNHVDLCAIINAKSGNCGMDCIFCSQSRHNSTGVATFDLLPDEELRKRILTLAATPVHHIGIVTSGGALGEAELERLGDLVAALPDPVRPRVCASLGRLRPGQLEALRSRGLVRYHHNLESSRGFYSHVCTTQTWEQRRDTVLAAARAGLGNCTGGLFGLGESWDDRIDFAFQLRELGVRNVPINFLHAHPHTPLATQPPLPASEALKIIALFRHILPRATLRVCGGRPEILGARQGEMFAAGANALMTGDYLTTRGSALEADLAMLAASHMQLSPQPDCEVCDS